MFGTKSALVAIASFAIATATPVRRTQNFDGYKIFTEEVSQPDAKAGCAAFGGELVSIHSREQNDYLYSLALSAGVTDGYWTAGKRIGSGNDDSNFVWETPTGDEPFSASLPNVDNDGNHDLWVRKEPNHYRGKENCIRAGMVDGRWNDARCEMKHAYMCYRAPTTTTTTEGPTTTTTPEATTTTTAEPTTTTTAEPTTTTSEEPTTTTTEKPTTTTTEKPSTTTTEKPSTTTTEKPSTTTTEKPTTTTTEKPTTTTTAEPTTTTPEPTTLVWPETWDYFDETGCWYKEFDTKSTRTEAVTACELEVFDRPAWLVDPQTIEEAKFVASLGRAGKPAWTAGYRASLTDSFVYTEGDEKNDVLLGNWYDGEPNGANHLDHCVQRGKSKVRQDTSPWKFNDADCTAKIHYTCKYCHATTTTTTTMEPTTTTTIVTTTTTEKPTTTTTTTPEPTTMDVPDWEEYDGCYYHQGTTKKTFAEALVACADPAMDGHYEARSASSLAIPKSEEQAKFIAAFEDRAGSPRWIGVGAVAGKFMTFSPPDGVQWSPTFDNYVRNNFKTDLWYAGEPSGEDCVQMGYNKKKDDRYPWRLNDANCNNRNLYVCQWCPPAEPTTTTTVGPTTTTTTVEGTTTTTVEGTTTTTTEGTTTTTVEGTTTTTEEPMTGGTGPLVDEVEELSVSPTPMPTPMPTTPEPTPLPTPMPSNDPTAQPTPMPSGEPTPSPTTSEPTPAPTTMEPTAQPTCSVGPGNAELARGVSALAEHHQYVAAMLGSLATKKSGRAEPFKTSCEDYCAQRSFGLGCQPCRLETLKSEAECMFPGPFGTGVLCHKEPKTQVTTELKCCMRKNENLDYATGNQYTTCRLPKRECDCDAGFNYDEAFEASKYMAPLKRVWTGSECVAL